MGTLATIYSTIQARVDALLRPLLPGAGTVAVPATPGWTVHDLVAHISGIPDDALHGRMDGVASEQWTAAQVERGRELTTVALLDRWNGQTPRFAARLDESGQWPAVFDLLSHEFDLRHALGDSGGRDARELTLLAKMIAAGAGPMLIVETESGPLSGGAEATATVCTSDFEVFRSRFGRRSRSQVERYEWTGEPADVAAAIDSWFIFGPATEEVSE